MVDAHSHLPFLVFLQDGMRQKTTKQNKNKRKKSILVHLAVFIMARSAFVSASVPLTNDAIPQFLENASGNFADKCHFLNLAFGHLINQ